KLFTSTDSPIYFHGCTLRVSQLTGVHDRVPLQQTCQHDEIVNGPFVRAQLPYSSLALLISGNDAVSARQESCARQLDQVSQGRSQRIPVLCIPHPCCLVGSSSQNPFAIGTKNRCSYPVFMSK